MIDTSKLGERLLQNYRFRTARKHLRGDVMDFGGNQGELRPYVTGDYIVVNYDHSVMGDKRFDTIAALAVIEHIRTGDVYDIFGKLTRSHMQPSGKIVLTTPTPMSKPLLSLLSRFGIIGRENIEEHKHYWTRADIERLAASIGLRVEEYRKFQLGFNQIAVLSKAETM